MSDGERSPSLSTHTTTMTDVTSSIISSPHTSPPGGNSPQHTSRERSGTRGENGSPTHHRGHYYVNVAPVRGKELSASPPKVKSPEKVSAIYWKPPHALPKPRRDDSPKHTPSTGKIPPPKIASSKTYVGHTDSDGTNPFSSLIPHGKTQQVEDIHQRPLDQSRPPQQSSPHGMRRSFRYRRITLRKEKPVFTEVPEEEEDCSSDETDREQSSERIMEPSLYHKREMAKSSPNLSEIGRPKAGRVKNCVRLDFTRETHVNESFSPLYNPLPPSCSYSKVTVVGVKVQNCSSNEMSLPAVTLNVDRKSLRRSRSSMHNSSSDGALCSPLCSPLPDCLRLPDPISLSDEEEEIFLPNRYLQRIVLALHDTL